MKLLKRMDVALVLLIASLGLLSGVSAQPLPDKTIQYIIPFPAAGESDLVARYQSDLSVRKYKQQMMVLKCVGDEEE